MHTLVRTKLDKPQRLSEFIARARLKQHLADAMDKRLILVSAPAGYGKTSFLADWLQESGHAWAWLSLDQIDSDLVTFVAYFIAAVQVTSPDVCKQTQAFLKGPHLPPSDHLVAALINDLTALPQDVILVLDDYQVIKDRIVHDFLSAVVYRCPRQLHLVIATRADPPLPVPQWRAHGYLTEIRAADLSFTPEEADFLLKHEFGISLSEQALTDLIALTEGWVTGLKLAAISLRERLARSENDHHDIAYADLQAASASQHVADYLFEDVFSRQPRAIREFLMRTSILDHFTAPLCDALGSSDPGDGVKHVRQARFVLKWIERANLFLIPLDPERRWFRYHHLFRDLLLHRLQQRYDAAEIAKLHTQASEWLANEGFIEDAMSHALAAGERQRAADLIEQHRHQLLDADNWRELERWLDLLPAELVQERPALLLARAWVLHFQSRKTAMALKVQEALAVLRELNGAGAHAQMLNSEIEVLLSQRDFYGNRFDEAQARARSALQHIPRSHAYVRGVAAVMLGLSTQALGQFGEGESTLEALFYQDQDRASPTALRALLTLAWMDCIAGDWDDVRTLSDYGLKLTSQHERWLMAGWARYYLALYFYQRNDLDHAIEHFAAAVQSRYSLHRHCALQCIIGLSLSHWARGNARQAAEAADLLAEFGLETQDPDVVYVSHAFRAHLSLLQNDVAPALHWVQTSDERQGLSPLIWPEIPRITRLRVLVADGSPASLRAATPLLDATLAYARSTHNVWREVELLAIQALALHKQGQTEASLDALEQALTLARPGHFVRTFLDLGCDLAALLTELVRRNRQADYACALLDGFGSPAPKLGRAAPMAESTLVEPLTNREAEILDLMSRHLSNEEIAQALFISRLTVKSHTRNLFDKLGVKRRRFAVERARELGLLPAA